MKRSGKMKFKDNLRLQIVVLTAVVSALCLIGSLSERSTFTSYIRVNRPSAGGQPPEIEVGGEQLFEVLEEEYAGKYVRLKLKPVRQGEGFLNLKEGENDYLGGSAYTVTRLGTVYDKGSGDFSGQKIFLCALTAYFFAVGFLMLRDFRRSKGSAFYSYSSVYTAGFSLFALSIGIQMLIVTVHHLSDPIRYPMRSAYSAFYSMSYRFLTLMTPFILAFSVAMAVSNLELLRHERRRFRNVLGILVGVCLIGGEFVVFWLYGREFSGSALDMRIHNTIQGVYATFFAYFVCMLVGAEICGLRAARHVPAPEQEYVIILGCGFRKDGTLTPLLKGRVDGAIAFARRQKEQTGRDLIYVPSGGQGPDEVTSESEAMSRYLLSVGIPEEQILREDQSRNTFENMAFSGKLIQERSPDAKVIFSTTNYHVFRSGVWAQLAGLDAEGIGCDTKWWFWPNAFVRECVGLLVNRWKTEILGLLLMIAVFSLLTILLI